MKIVKINIPLAFIITLGYVPIFFFVAFKISISAVFILGLIYCIITYVLLGLEMVFNTILIVVCGLVSHSNPFHFIGGGPEVAITELYWQWVYLISLLAAWPTGASAIRSFFSSPDVIKKMVEDE